MTDLATTGGVTQLCPDFEPRARRHDRDERRFDLVIHLVGGSAALTGAVVLTRVAAGRGWAVALPVAAYAFAMVLTFFASAAYNLCFDTGLRAPLRRLDHSAIFVMIAGTYTPFTVCLARGEAAIVSTVCLWAVALAGIGLKLASPRFFERIGVGIYLALGWGGALILPYVAPSLSRTSMTLLALGGALYTTGVFFHLRETLRFHNAIWHLFVLAAACCHFTCVLESVALG